MSGKPNYISLIQGYSLNIFTKTNYLTRSDNISYYLLVLPYYYQNIKNNTK